MIDDADADLIALGERLRAAIDASKEAVGRGTTDGDAAFDRHYDEAAEVFGQIVALPAKTVAGLAVKALAVDWTGAASVFENMDYNIDVVACRSLLDDINAMAAVKPAAGEA